MADLFQTSRTNAVKHIRHIYEEGELTEEATCRKFRQVRQEGSREVSRALPFYNLDMITPVRLQDYGIKQQTQTTRIQRYMVNHI